MGLEYAPLCYANDFNWHFVADLFLVLFFNVTQLCNFLVLFDSFKCFLFCSVLFCFVLWWFFVLCCVLFCFFISSSVLWWFVWFFILCFILLCHFLCLVDLFKCFFLLLLFCSVLFYDFFLCCVMFCFFIFKLCCVLLCFIVFSLVLIWFAILFDRLLNFILVFYLGFIFFCSVFRLCYGMLEKENIRKRCILRSMWIVGS